MRSPATWRKRLGWLAFWLLLIHFVIEFTGYHYLYTTLANTVFKGRLGPAIQEYQHMPKRALSAGTPSAWPVHETYNSMALSKEEEAYHLANESVSFLVIHNDSLVYESYWDGFTDTTRSNSFSMAKSVVSVLTGIAISRGEIKSVDDPVFHYLPQYERGLGKQLTLRHLLTMSSGFNFNESYINPFAFPAKANYGDNLELLLSQYEVTDAPGETFIYQSGSTQVLAFAFMAATRSSLADYASAHLWQKIGAEHPAVWTLDAPDGSEKAFCCINATARDFARIGKLYLHYGRWEGEQILDSSYVAQSLRPSGANNPDGTPCSIYGYSWWLGESDGHSFYMMRGIKGQYVIVVPEYNLIVVRMGRKRDVGTGREHPVDVYQYIKMGLRQIGA